jgi:hypothetical protein
LGVGVLGWVEGDVDAAWSMLDAAAADLHPTVSLQPLDQKSLYLKYWLTKMMRHGVLTLVLISRDLVSWCWGEVALVG